MIKRDNKLRANREIRAREVRLIDAEGTMMGVTPLMKALSLAEEAGLDLVEISPNAEPPVCKIMDLGKMLFQQQKKSGGVKKQKTLPVKEIKMSPNIGMGDYDTKLRQTKKFLEKGHKVKFSFKFKGREIQHSDLLQDLVAKIIEETKEISKIELKPRMEGKKLFFILGPIK